MPLDEKGPLERGVEREAPLKNVILPLLAALVLNQLQIVTDIGLLLIITSTGDELLSSVNIDDPEWPQTPKIKGFSEFFAISRCDTHFKNELRRNGWG